MASKGYSIIAVSDQSEELIKLKCELEKEYQIRLETIDCDLAEIATAENIFDFCQQKNLQVEILVNNAGILVYGEVVNIDVKNTSTSYEYTSSVVQVI